MSSEQEPTVTIISPFYKRASVVERTLRSIQAQSYRNFTAIIWDDDSKDGTWEEIERVRRLMNDDRFVTFQNRPNIGLTSGLNKAVRMAEGEYIAVVGSGDTCHSDRIAVQVAALENDARAVFCATASSSIDEVTGDIFIDSSFKGTQILREHLIKKVPFTHGSVMYRRRAILDAGMYEPTFKWCADWDLFLRLMTLGHGVYVPQSLYCRYAMLDGVSFNPAKSMEQVQYKYLVKMLSESPSSRRLEILAAARSTLHETLRRYHAQIAHDLWKRQIKLMFLGRCEDSNHLRELIESGYGTSTAKSIGTFIARCFTALPISSSKMISFARTIAAITR